MKISASSGDTDTDRVVAIKDKFPKKDSTPSAILLSTMGMDMEAWLPTLCPDVKEIV